VHGFSDEFLSQQWIGLSTDGASVMLGSHSGVAKLKESFSRIIAWHCFNHHIELFVCDAVKCCTAVNHCKAFIECLYVMYSMSPKCQRELAECASELDVQLNRIGRILSVRCFASSYHTVRSVWLSYEALHLHSTRQASDLLTESREKAKFSGLAKKLESGAFIKKMMHYAICAGSYGLIRLSKD